VYNIAGEVIIMDNDEVVNGERADEELDAEVQAILDSDDSDSTKIKKLHDLGYSNTQIHQEFGFKKSTVYRVCPVRPAGPKGNNKMSGEKASGRALMKIGGRDVIPPEAVLEVIHLPSDGQDVQTWRNGVMDGVGLMLLGARYAQLTSAAQAEILTNQIKIMEESRKGSTDAAREAAMQAAAQVGAQVLPRIDQLSAQVSGGENPMAGLMMTLMQPAFQQAAQQLARLFGATQMPGMPAQQPQEQQAQQPVQPQQPAWRPPNIRVHSIDEWEED